MNALQSNHVANDYNAPLRIAPGIGADAGAHILYLETDPAMVAAINTDMEMVEVYVVHVYDESYHHADLPAPYEVQRKELLSNGCICLVSIGWSHSYEGALRLMTDDFFEQRD